MPPNSYEQYLEVAKAIRRKYKLEHTYWKDVLEQWLFCHVVLQSRNNKSCKRR
jgi:hypothetical protein